MIKGLKRYHYDTDRFNIVGMVGLDRIDHIGLVPDPNFKTIPKVPVPFIGGASSPAPPSHITHSSLSFSQTESESKI